MATPKKKISRSRRDIRRGGSTHQVTEPTWAPSSVDGELVRPHRVTLDTVDQYVEMRKKAKSARKSAQ